MAQLVVALRGKHLVPDCALGHIQAPEAALSGSVLPLMDKLDASDSRILGCVLGKALRLAEIVCKIGAVRLQNVNHVSENVIPADNKEIRVEGSRFPILLIGDTERPFFL